MSLRTVLEKFKNRISYKKFDADALDISRSLAAGSLGTEDNFAQWASITNDPKVIVNYVKSYVTQLVSKMSGAPFRPEDDGLKDVGLSIGLNARFSEQYKSVLEDGYSFLAVGMNNGTPVVKSVDSRYIMFNGDDPTLKDATDVAVFEIVPLTEEEKADKATAQMIPFTDFAAYVTFDPNAERVRVSHYHFDEKKGQYFLDIYDKDPEKPESWPLGTIDRIPVVRFVGDAVELSDKRWHYRGIYYFLSSVVKAVALTGTKIQGRVSSYDYDNYIAPDAAISNHQLSWDNSGVKTIDDKDGNQVPVPGIQFIPHDDHFLLDSFRLWKEVIADMLGPTIASGSEAVTREEVIARQEIKDAITNLYLTKMVDSISEVYRCIKMLDGGDNAHVIVVGGYIENVKKEKQLGELVKIYNFAKESGLNCQGLVQEMLVLTDIDTEMKGRIKATFEQDPYKSPLVMQLQQQIQQLQQAMQQKDTQIALLRIQATQRLERQGEAIAADERMKRLELTSKQNIEEMKQTQEANMEVLRTLLANGDYEGARRVVEAINLKEPPVVADPQLGEYADANTEATMSSIRQQLIGSGAQQPQPQPQVQAPPQATPPNPVQPQPQLQQNRMTPPGPRAAATLFTNV